jgi:hypothetical protein
MGTGCRITIEVLENGYEVTIPDVAAMDKANAAAKKKPGAPTPWMGDYTKSYAAKTAKEVVALVTPALTNLPQQTYDEAFAEASAENDT